MSQSAKIIIAVVLVAVLAGGAILIGNMQKEDKNGSSSSTSQNNTSSGDNQSSGEVTATITFDGNNFNITENTIKSGDKVKIVNSSQTDLEFDSDPHPVHTDNKELNVDMVAPGESKTFTITKTGTWGFHNHLNASQRGSITVQ